MTLQLELCIGLSAMLVAGAACDDAGQVRSPSRSEVGLDSAAQGLCDAEEQAHGGSLESARSTFFDRSHGYLHELAATLSERDPRAAGALLEAKQRLEAVLDPTLGSGDDPPAGAVAARVADLRDALDRAAVAAGLPEPRCEESAA